MNHPVKHLRFPKAAVETLAEFRRITGQMLGTDAMVDTPVIAFELAIKVWTQGRTFEPPSPNQAPATRDGDWEKHPGSYSLASQSVLKTASIASRSSTKG